VRVVIADDSALIRDGLRHVLGARGFDVVAAVPDAGELLQAATDAAPDVALVDIRMPPTHTTEGLDAALALREQMPGLAVLVLSQYVEAEYALRLLRERPAGTGYLLKQRVTEIETLMSAIERVAAGESVVDPELVGLLLERRPKIAELTERELEVLALVAEGLTDRGIAKRLWLTPKTVETHVRHILSKLALPSDDRNRRVLAVLEYLRDERGP
jgi:DNA-binding NarL/FixJ family response regulator